MSKKSLVGYTIFGADHLTEQGLTAALTSQDIANLAILGITLGGWVSIVVMIGALCLAFYNIYKFYCFIRDRHALKKFKNKEEKLYEHSSS